MPRVERVEFLDDKEYQNGAEGGREVEATETRTLTVGGKQFQLYLCEANAKLFDEDMAVWTQFASPVTKTKATKTTGSSGGGGSSAGRTDRGFSARVRTWAKDQHFEDVEIKDRGRIPDFVTEAYLAAHPEDRPGS
jgi:hypothetical protein